MKQKNKIILSLGGIVTLLLITIGLSYAYFTANITGGEDSTTITVTGGRMNIYYDGGADINVEDIVPKDNPIATKTFTVTGNNTTDQEMRYKISLEVVANTFTEEALKYKLISENTDENGTVAPSSETLTDIGTGAKTIELGVGEFASPTGGNKVHTYNLELYFLNQDYNQNEDQGKEIRAYVKIENDPCAAGNCLRDLILAQGGGAETIEAKGNPNFANKSPNTEVQLLGYEAQITVHDSGKEMRAWAELGVLVAVGTDYALNEETGMFNLVNYTLDNNLLNGNHAQKYVCFDYEMNNTPNNQYEECATILQIQTVYDMEDFIEYDVEKSISVIERYDVIDPGDTGLYAAEDEYGTSYYFRGAKSYLNNNLIFGGFQWKIIRINGDGSIRIMYNGTESMFTSAGKINKTGESTLIGSSDINWGGMNDAKHVGYMYGSANPSTQRNGIVPAAATYNETSSTAKTTLDSWYQTNISGKAFESYIVDNLFCNDRQKQDDPEVGGPATGPGYGEGYDEEGQEVSTTYAPNYRLITNKTPTLKCGLKNDRFTKNDTTIGNGALTYPIGLITADEALMSGLIYDWMIGNQTNYLNSNVPYWTMSPHGSCGGACSNGVFGVSSGGSLEGFGMWGDTNGGFRAVINLSSSVKVTGSGTATDPYVVEE